MRKHSTPMPEAGGTITAAIIAALAVAGSTATAAAQKAAEDSNARYWMIGEIENNTTYDLKLEHTLALHGEWLKSPPRYIRGDTQLGENYLALAKELFGVTALIDLTADQVAALVAAAQGENKGGGDEDEENFGVCSLESTGAGVEGVAVYDVVGHALYACFLLDNPQGASAKKAGCSIISKTFFDKKGYEDDLEALIDHIFATHSGHTKIESSGKTGEVTHGLSGGTLEIGWTVAHTTKFEVDYKT